MADFKSLYYHLAGQTATAVDFLEATTTIMEANAKAMLVSIEALTELKERLKFAQQRTEEMFISAEDGETE